MVALTYLLYFSNIHLGFEAVPYYLFLYIFRFNNVLLLYYSIFNIYLVFSILCLACRITSKISPVMTFSSLQTSIVSFLLE